MEELLNKNIFRDAELLKYAPDYNSQDIYLRLQLRRDMAKDTQKHRHKKTNPSKKELQPKIYNNLFKVNTEIAKVHTLFRNRDAENKLILKECKKQNNYNVRPDIHYSNSKLDDNEDNLLEKEMCVYVQASQELPDLTVENKSDFKLIPKFRHTSISDKRLQNDNMKLPCKSNEKKLVLNKTRQCTYSQDDATKIALSTFEKEYCDDFTKDNDLQSLLIMMTISSNSNGSNDYEKPNEDHGRFNNNLEEKTDIYTNDNIQKSSEATTLETIEGNRICDILNIKPFKREDDRRKFIIKKYIQKWQAYVKLKTENMIHSQRQQTLNMFLDKLRKTKDTVNKTAGSINRSKVLVRDYNSYQHRYKVQKNIIALQKAKLEHQNKLIEKLKYNKIIEASRQSLDSMKEEVRKTYYEIDKNLKPKIKLLTNELNIKEIEEPSLVLHCLKMPQFLQRMEARAREREEKHAIIRERRKQMEEEKVRLKQQAELEKAEMDKEEKLKRMKELKERRKREKIENIRKKQHAERLRALTVMADLHYEKNLMIKYGLEPFQRLIQIKRENTEKARNHYKFQLMKNVFLNWMFYTEDMWFERNYKAEEFYRKTILTRTFNALKKTHYNFIIRKQVAEDYYDLYVTQLAFSKFREYVRIVKEEFSMKWAKAVNYHNCNLLFKTFTCWRTLPALNALKREQEARKLKWRQKVLQVVPDYKPPDD